MTLLGPSSLNIPHRKVLNRKENKKLIKKYLQGEIGWSDKSLKLMKDNIRTLLRNEQEDRCIYCRRIIKIDRRNVSEDIEHYLDKSRDYYKKWAFSPLNLTLSCRPCNFVKNTKDLGDPSMRTTNNILNGVGRFKWIHPYFDDYHANIEIKKGWLYSIKQGAPNPTASAQMISNCELDKIERIERIGEEIKERQSRITDLMLKCMAKQQHARSQKLGIWLKFEQDRNWFDY
ncbi:hypothetical protein EJ063_08770 [Vibrio aquaticus]|uniref:TIGR02646 family protein n=1 Tax=Vibrio aquaticus TaxID=2496559 RepID=A0A432CYG1_9VIBR|nr:hypothetical protein [Vibrio aquaticus]RTZ16869.1 hypothetical protein EJ063_08770 [Vibrio aquaticus]